MSRKWLTKLFSVRDKRFPIPTPCIAKMVHLQGKLRDFFFNSFGQPITSLSPADIE